MNRAVCCFTGHRSLPREEVPALAARLSQTVRMLADEGVIHFVAGGALGFDTLAAQTVLTLRESLPHIKLTLMLPCRGQDAHWRDDDRREYRRIYHAADFKTFLAPAYFDGCMRARNQAMVDKSGVCVAYVTRASSGAGQTLRMAAAAGCRIINLGAR